MLLVLFTSPAWAEPPARSEPSRPLRPLIGEWRFDLVRPDETLLDVAFRNGLGFEPVARLNPGVDTWIPAPGTVIRLPTRTILPDADAEGLVINIPELRLFDFTVKDGPEIVAAAVGDADDPTPSGDFEIGEKRVDPVWHVPKSIRSKRPELPDRVPAGPDNPLGSRWMRISATAYGIHGTNTRWSIGREATHGCVRLYERDVLRLFDRIPVGTRLQIVYQPYKWGRDGSRIFFEAHPDRYARIEDPLTTALAPIRALGLLDRVDTERVWRVLGESAGVPVVVGSLPDGWSDVLP